MKIEITFRNKKLNQAWPNLSTQLEGELTGYPMDIKLFEAIKWVSHEFWLYVSYEDKYTLYPMDIKLFEAIKWVSCWFTVNKYTYYSFKNRLPSKGQIWSYPTQVSEI